MIKNVTVTNHLGESITLEMRFPEKSGFLIKSIDGLGPTKANINTTEVVTSDGSLYNSSHVSQRNLVFRLGLLEKSTVEESRLKTYRYFPIRKKVTITIETDSRTCMTEGYVESNEPDIFSSEETTNISIICPDAYFYSTTQNSTYFSGSIPTFEFPFSNESLTENLLEMSQLELTTQELIIYSGDASVGILIYIHAIGEASGIEIINTRTNETMALDSDKIVAITGEGIHSGDDIIISTIKGNKYIVLQRNGVLYNILNALDKDADWFQLDTGDNIFAYTVDGGAGNLQFRIVNSVAYEGV